jgi:hypothetical protein
LFGKPEQILGKQHETFGLSVNVQPPNIKAVELAGDAKFSN